MVSKTIRIALVIACIVVAWSLGRAQTTVADFEISIDAPGGGDVRVKCLRGCDWRTLSPDSPPVAKFECAGASRCGATLNGRNFTAKHAK